MKVGSQAPLHKHCVVCGRPISFMYTTPGEPPLCSIDCRAKFEAQRAKVARWQWLFNAMLIFILLWFLTSLIMSSLRP
ncbi:MAG: DUF2116 family Zn-ribbon domain-containing protein [Candidatus Nezhaarchaeales archaeon]